MFLTGQFEAAVDFLFRVDRLRAHSVHIALALYELNLLLLPANIQAAVITRDASDGAKGPTREARTRRNRSKGLLCQTR